MRAILIDPVTKTVTEVEYDGDYRNISKLLGCELFTTALHIGPTRDSSDVLFVDDEGLLTNPNPLGYFTLPLLYGGVLAGKGLVVGPELHDDQGEYIRTDDVRSSLHAVEHAVVFIDNPSEESISPKITITDWNGNPL